MIMTATGTTTNNDTHGANGSPQPKAPPTALEAITRIAKILKPLSPADRKRVLAFLDESAE